MFLVCLLFPCSAQKSFKIVWTKILSIICIFYTFCDIKFSDIGKKILLFQFQPVKLEDAESP